MTAVGGVVTVMSRAGCHRCEVVVDTITRVLVGTAYQLVVMDVDTDPELRAEYGDQVPVVLINGAEHDYGSVDETRFRAALH